MLHRKRPFRVALVNLCEDAYGYGPGASEYLRAQILATPDLGGSTEVDILFLERSSADQVADRVMALNPDLVGFSTYSWNLRANVDAGRALKRRGSEAPIVWGGCSFSLLRERHDWFRWWDAVDAVAVGAGESIIVDLVRTLAAQERPLRIEQPLAGLAIQREGTVVFGPPAAPPRSLDQVASPYQMGAVFRVARPYIEMARGCKFQCTFCSDARVSRQGMWLTARVDRIAADVAAVVAWPEAEWVDAGASTANVTDEHFVEVCDSVRRGDPQARLQYSFQLYPAIVRRLQREALEGIRVGKLCFGLQSTSPATWGPMRRKGTMEHLAKALEIMRGTGPMYVSLILGLPGETYDSFRHVFDEVVALPGLHVSVHRLLLLPGTQLHRDHELYGLDFDPDCFWRVRSSATMSATDLARAQEYVVDRTARVTDLLLDGRPRIDWTNFDAQRDAFQAPAYGAHVHA